MRNEKNKYQDIIDYNYTGSQRLNKMSVQDRAAQFAPFAALSGHGEAVKEIARIVDEKIELGEDAIQEITEKLNYIEANIKDLIISITYFVPDSRKYGGRYVTRTTSVKKIDNINRSLILKNGIEINFDNIYDIVIE